MKKSHLSLFVPSVAVGIIFLIVLAMGGFWPFGKATVDYYDMAQWAYPFYYHNFDELAGVKSFLFDWYTNLGRVIPGLNEPSPFDLLFLIIPRNRILEWMSVLMLIKIMAMAFTQNLFIGYIKPDIPFSYRLMLAGGYGMCGFVLVNYTVPMWLDMAVFVPLILMFSQKALKTGKFAGLVITVFLIMLDDYYFTIQTLMFVFLIGGAYLIYRRFTNKGTDPENLYVLRFAAGIVIAVALSAFSWIPDIANGMTSARFSNGTSEGGIIATYLETIAQISPAYLSRWFSLFGLSFPAALLLWDSKRLVSKKRYAGIIFAAVCILMPASQLFCESIHLLLHFMSYVNYPMRNGFMIYCIVSAFAAGLYERNENEAAYNDITKPGIIKTATGAVISAAVIIAFHVWYLAHPGLSDHFIMLFGLGIMTALCFINLAFIGTAGGRYARLAVFVWVAELALFGMIMIGKPLYDSPYGNDPEQEGDYIRISDQLVASFGDSFQTGDDAATFRVKNPDTSLNANYGVIMRRETLSGWTNLATGEQIDGAVSLGYSSQFTRILDAGGNIFADTILHITDIISHRELPEKLYDKISEATVVTDNATGQTQEYYLYKNRYELPFAIPVQSIPDMSDAETVADTVNAYASAMGAGGIATVIKAEPSSENGGAKEYAIDVTGNKALYFKGDCVDAEYYNTTIRVNGTPVPVPSIKENENVLFPAHFNNNSLELGAFSDETVNVRVEMDDSDPDKVYDHYFYAIDLDALGKLCEDMAGATGTQRTRRGLRISPSDACTGCTGFLVPVPYNSGWSATAGGKKLSVSDAGGLFMYVKSDGKEEITMSYFPTYMLCGIVTAVIGLICFAALVLYDRKHTRKCTKADIILARIYIAAFAAASLVIYVIPLLYAGGEVIKHLFDAR